MTDIAVTGIGSKQRDGHYPVTGHRVNDARQKLVLFLTDRAGVEAIGAVIQENDEGVPTVVEVDDRAWSFVFTQVAA